MPTNPRTESFLDPSSERGKTRGANPIETLDKAYDNHQADVRPSKLADSARFLFEQMQPAVFRELGVREPDPADPESRDDILAALGERNLYLVFEGTKPPGDDRNFVYGDSEKQLSAAILVLGAYPFRPDEQQGADFYLCRPDSQMGRRSSWMIDEVEEPLINALLDLAGRREGDDQTEEDLPEEDQPDDEE